MRRENRPRVSRVSRRVSRVSEMELFVLQEKQQSRFSPNFYLGSLFITLIGTLLFLVNARGLSEIQGLLVISVLLMTAPLLFYIFYEKCSLSRGQSLSLLLIPLFALQYIFYLQAGAPVGFTDPHHHIFICWNLFTDGGKILFENVQQISLNFVGLYVLFRLLSLASSLDIVTLAGIIPPFINILIITAVYLVVNRLHEHRTGLLAATLYGWENMVHILGQELRTQTMGVLILFTVTALLLILNKKTARSSVFAAVILLAGLVTTSFVCNFYALLVFTGAVCAVFIWFLYKRDLDWLVINSLSIVLYIAFLAFFAVYLLFVSKGFAPLLAQFSHMLFNALGQAMVPELGGIITKSILLIFLGVAIVIGFGLLYLLINKITKWLRPSNAGKAIEPKPRTFPLSSSANSCQLFSRRTAISTLLFKLFKLLLLSAAPLPGNCRQSRSTSAACHPLKPLFCIPSTISSAQKSRYPFSPTTSTRPSAAAAASCPSGSKQV
jgi:hypothetical protein